MSEELKRQGFLEAILQEPDVADHRLVFVDWLEDQGCSEEAKKYRELPGTAAAWCTDWGTDGYGLWCELAIGKVRQRLRWIPPGSFQMGSPEEEEGREENEGPRHQVEISHGFWMFDAPCAQELWKVVMGSNPSCFRGAKRPVERVSWRDCETFLTKLNNRIQGLSLRLPTEAQWEYACRAGTEGPRYEKDVDRIAWHKGNSAEATHPVREKEPNGFGLYDMLGNVCEWCLDCQRDYREESVIDPVGEPKDYDGDRAVRGGSWAHPASFARSADRLGISPDYKSIHVGFRCIMQA